ncbi:hypothetical protein TNCV_916601 [Trichonephila clavipes]|nr:hypothetical protein TNCV_916601 [Trichonephila clavipes]
MSEAVFQFRTSKIDESAISVFENASSANPHCSKCYISGDVTGMKENDKQSGCNQIFLNYMGPGMLLLENCPSMTCRVSFDTIGPKILTYRCADKAVHTTD